MPNNAANKTCSGAPRRAVATRFSRGPASQPQGNLAMLLQAMIATEDGPAAALAASMMAETNTPMAPVVT